MELIKCKNCIFPIYFNTCPTQWHRNNAACLTLAQDVKDCNKNKCLECRWKDRCERADGLLKGE